jgi:hypothetical protein
VETPGEAEPLIAALLDVPLTLGAAQLGNSPMVLAEDLRQCCQLEKPTTLSATHRAYLRPSNVGWWQLCECTKPLGIVPIYRSIASDIFALCPSFENHKDMLLRYIGTDQWGLALLLRSSNHDVGGGPMKKRYKARMTLHAPAVFTMDQCIGEGQVLNLTHPGCLIGSPATVKIGDCLELKLVIPELTSPLLVTLAVVRWTKQGKFGAEFIKMAEPERSKLDQLMARYMRGLVPAQSNRLQFSDGAVHNWHLPAYSVRERN